MATNKTKIRRFKKVNSNNASLIEYFLSGETNDFETFMLSANDEKMKLLWEENKAVILQDWIAEHPGSRPAAWWCYDAPRAERFKGTPWEISQPEPRRRLNGESIYSGNEIPHLIKAIPDGEDPALFESERQYLERHGLLMPEEIKQRYGEKVITGERYKNEN